ncbi:MAG: sulfur transferase domain-containing protein [Acidobacteriota bacterium]|nr:sulfur transferase domain-containing protein [Acidobacteriota bacterium]
MTRSMLTMVAVAGVALGAATADAQVQRQEVPGIRNFTQVDLTIACAGATDASAIPEIAKRGFKAMINLRLASESGANIDEAKRAAAAAGISYMHMPFDVANPDEAVVDQFLAAVTNTANQPVFVHCGSANRAAALWMIKRAVTDNWDANRAETEAREIGLSSPALRDFALAQIAKRRGR